MFHFSPASRLIACLAAAAVLALPMATGAAAPATPTGGPTPPAINPADFVEEINNPYFPLTPRTTFFFEGAKGKLKQHNEVEVTTETKTILGVRCVVIRDRVSEDGQLIEDTLDWYAQDKAGNVWYFGEAAKDYKHGKVTSTEGSWEAGVNGAQPGIIMPARPSVGAPYRQEYAAGVAEDMGQVIKTGASVTTPFGTFHNVVVTKDWSPLQPDLVEQKYYAPGVGVILAVSKSEKERIELVNVEPAPAATPLATPGA